jgi:hypothetical protein
VPERFGPTALGLLQQILARGVVLELCRRGGWRESEHLRDGQVRSGRLWERGELPALRFSRRSVELLRWLTAAPLSAGRECRALEVAGEPTVGDELLLYLVCDLAERCSCAAGVAGSPAFRRATLPWLGFTDVLARQAPPPDDAVSLRAFARWTSGDGALVLEALQEDLARRWLAMERRKREISGVATMINLGAAQEAVLAHLCAAADAQGRRDLLGFLHAAAARLVGHRPPAAEWIAGLAAQGTLQQRTTAYRAAGATLRSLDRLHTWVVEAQGVRFFEDEYGAAQLLLRQWEPLGLAGHDHARQVLAQLESLAAVSRISEAAAAASSASAKNEEARR